jgi:hypothetical protein
VVEADDEENHYCFVNAGLPEELMVVVLEMTDCGLPGQQV